MAAQSISPLEEQFGCIYRVASLGLWWSVNEVHADRIPTIFWNRDRLHQSLLLLARGIVPHARLARSHNRLNVFKHALPTESQLDSVGDMLDAWVRCCRCVVMVVQYCQLQLSTFKTTQLLHLVL
ncbi:uncharacterized protein PHALS_01118 [Plasmopara halstedii]|uniref:Uncharacterized protein n=1 Tax=Plasmopara halstedii TaxID=4781 RepID=A0A0P1AUV4_PLAHL|nr:uncharacterized protein PHALS_01118 [Plasmopara halstedii]CEG44781.1 hypothetical protein PHALS_01118 [Plasmopara halstedii]|eukprot:XP_024581150.1 hypothetical protein PHALS_01118 [Plasmopara halstedii]